MKKLSLISYLISFIFIISAPLSAENLMEPEIIATVNHSLSSDPQPGVDYHVINVCKDFQMLVDCRQCTYDASADGSLNIPTYNRCVIRTEQDISHADQIGDRQFYKFFYQFKAGMTGGPESEWTEPKIVSVVSIYGNNPGYGYAYLFVQYDQE
jgi:hypothetical protein